MTKDELFKLIDLKVDGLRNRAIIKDAVEDYSSASNNGKPIVTRSLPCSCENQKLGQLECDNACVDSGEFD